MRRWSRKDDSSRWVGPVLLALLPLWAVGALLRGLWTPDEPRVADIVWRMAWQHQWALPHLAGQPFLEEPPLSYWAAALCVRAFGDSAAALRIPNLLYALVVALAIGTLGFSLLIGLWCSESQRLPGTAARPLRWTRRTVAIIAAVFAAAIIALATVQAPSMCRAGIDLALAATVLLGLLFALHRASQTDRHGQVLLSFGWTFSAYAGAFCLSALALFPTIDRWQELPALARRIHVETRRHPLALLDPDETTVAMLDRGLRTRFTRIEVPEAAAGRTIAHWFAMLGPGARVLVLLPGHAMGPFTPLLTRLGIRPPGDGQAGGLQAADAARIVHRYDLPHGRRYALLAPPEGVSRTVSIFGSSRHPQ